MLSLVLIAALSMRPHVLFRISWEDHPPRDVPTIESVCALSDDEPLVKPFEPLAPAHAAPRGPKIATYTGKRLARYPHDWLAPPAD